MPCPLGSAGNDVFAPARTVGVPDSDDPDVGQVDGLALVRRTVFVWADAPSYERVEGSGPLVQGAKTSPMAALLR